jgi:hypothetical protein
MRAIFDKLNDSQAKYCSLTEHLAVDEIIVLLRDIVIFKQYTPKTGCVIIREIQYECVFR